MDSNDARRSNLAIGYLSFLGSAQKLVHLQHLRTIGFLDSAENLLPVGQICNKTVCNELISCNGRYSFWPYNSPA